MYFCVRIDRNWNQVDGKTALCEAVAWGSEGSIRELARFVVFAMVEHLDIVWSQARSLSGPGDERRLDCVIAGS